MATSYSSCSRLSNDEVGLIVNRITNTDDRKSFSEVCKQWCKAEGLNRTSIRLLQLDSLRRVLPRFPNLVTFETSKCITQDDLEFLAQTCSKIETIDLGKPNDDETTEPSLSEIEVLYALAHSFPKLSKLSLRNSDYSGEGITQLIKELLAQNKLRHLDLGCCCVLDETLEVIGSLSCLSYLNLEGCDDITDEGLGFLANGSCSKILKTLVLTGCIGITDSVAHVLQKMSCLEELYLDGETSLSGNGLIAVSMIPTLKKLNLGLLTGGGDDPSACREVSEPCLLEYQVGNLVMEARSKWIPVGDSRLRILQP